jgi:N-acetylmuramoyl-L-alanine amidase
MMHPEDNWYIFHPRGQEDFARAMKEGIKEYFLSCDENNNGER